MIITMLNRFVLPRSDRYHAHAATGEVAVQEPERKDTKWSEPQERKKKNCCRKIKVTASVETGTEKWS